MRKSRLLAAASSVVVIASLAVAPSANAAEISAVTTIDKAVSTTEVVPGETFEYTITVGCSSITENGCFDATVTDVVPAEFEIIGVTAGPAQHAEPVIDGQSISVAFTEDLGDGQVGLWDSTTATVTVEVRVRDDLPYEANGVEVDNDAIITASNAETKDDIATVVPTVPLLLDTEATKSFDPTSALGVEGTPVTAQLGGTNTSNATVDTLMIQDPVDPDASPNPFEYLGFVGFGDVTPPDGADPALTEYEVYVDGQWVAASGGSLPAGVDPGDVRGTRVTFHGEIPAGATASVDLDLAHTELATAQPDGFVVDNTVQSEVALGDETATGQNSATYTLREDIIVVGAGKAFDPALVVPGETSEVTLTAANSSSTAIDALTITEPASGAFDDSIVFAGFTGPIVYPAGAEAAMITLQPGGEEIPVADGETPVLPDGVDPASVSGFEITFTGDAIEPDATATVPFTVQAADDIPLADLPVAVDNEIAVTGERGQNSETATADDTLYIYDEQIDVWIGKEVRPSEILAVPGESVTVSLTGGLKDRPDPSAEDPNEGSTVDVDQVVLQDPENVPAAEGEWWDSFDITSITQTPIPADSTLTIEYYDTTDGTWKVLSGPIDGPAVYSEQIPADIQAVAGGIRFVYDYTGTESDGFPPGTEFAPNFTSELREDSRVSPGTPAFDAENGGSLQNCATSEGTIDSSSVDPDATADAPACGDVELIPTDPGPGADLIDKEWQTSSSGGDKSVISRSGDTIPARLFWSTGGQSFDEVQLTDIADPAGTDIGDSVFDAFDLVRIEPITEAQDPYISFDAIDRVELYDGTDWVPASGDPCAGTTACFGEFPGYTLTPQEQLSTVGVRLVYVEHPDRDEVLAELYDQDPEAALAAPQVGTGVARSIPHDRTVDLTFQIRDERRDTSNPDPVLGEFPFNLLDPGVVRNTVNASGYVDDELTKSDDAQDDVIITDVPLTTTTNKDWFGGPVAVPSPGTDPSAYPASRVRIRTTNTTPAKVDQLAITDPGTPDAPTPFEEFDLARIFNVTEPAGADPDQTRVLLTQVNGDVEELTRQEALAATEASMTDVVGVRIEFNGRIEAGAVGDVRLDLRLRPTERTSGEDITEQSGPIFNEARGEVSDLGGEYDRYAEDQDDAAINLARPTFGVTTTKQVDPAQQKAGDYSPIDVELTAQPTGSTWASSMTITDADATFWNAMDFVGIDSAFELVSPIDYVRVDVVTDATFIGDLGGDLTVNGYDDWTTVAEGDAAAAKSWSDGLSETDAEEIQAIRFTFSASDPGAEGSEGTHPLQPVPLVFERRADLRSGDPVPTTNANDLAAPGEDSAGIFFNTVTATAVSIPINSAGEVLEADDEDTAEYRHLTLDTAVSVQKAPLGVQPPGTVIPFTLSFTNTGETDIHEPVFTDYIPSDADGPLLILDPDRDPTVSPYTFALSGSDPEPDWAPLPTDAGLIAIDESGTQITFTMPEGTALGIGQTYTITVPMMFRPGVAAATQVTNETSITATDPEQSFTECAAYPGEGQGPGAGENGEDVPVTECFDDTTVEPTVQPALSARKYVRADVPAHGAGSETNAGIAACRSGEAADDDGFFRSPCIPVSTPGTDVTWRFVMTNSGTLPIDHAVAIDHLPTPGDQGVIVELPRGSEWEGLFDAFESVQMVDPPAGATLTTYYSTSDTPCTVDLDPMSAGCADGQWLTQAEIGDDPSVVRSIKFDVEYAEGQLMEPGDTVTLEFRTHTQPYLDPAAGYPVAWNTVAVGGQAVEGADHVRIPSTEGRRVGVSYPTGTMRLDKLVTGPGAEFAPDEFSGVQVLCYVDDHLNDGTVEQVRVEGIDPLTLTPGVTATVPGIPAPAHCVVEEPDHGQTSWTITPEDGVDVQPSRSSVIPPIAHLTLENFYEVGGFALSKLVTDTGLDENGDPVALTDEYTFTAVCTFEGEEVLNTEVTLAAGGTQTFEGLPVGSECDVIETDAAGASGTTTSTTVGDGEPVIGEGTEAGFEIAGGEEVAVAVDFTNSYEVGSLQILKEVAGPGAPALSDGPFTFDVVCTLDNAVSNPVYSATHQLTQDDPTVTIDDLPAGAECTVTEVDSGGADAAPDPVTVTIPAEDPETGPVTVTAGFTNVFSAATGSIEKVLAGEAADEDWATGAEFTILAVCQVDIDGTIATVHSREYVIHGGEIVGLTNPDGTPVYLPLGAHCFIDETVTGGATDVEVNYDSYDNAAVVEEGDELQTLELVATNTFEYAGFDVAKEVTGSAADQARGYTFEVAAICTLDQGGASPLTVLDEAFEIRHGETVTRDRLPVGADCIVSETDAAGADSSTITVDGVTSAQAEFALTGDETVRVQVVNTFTAPLPATGMDAARVWIIGGVAVAILLLGGTLLLIARRRRG